MIVSKSRMRLLAVLPLMVIGSGCWNRPDSNGEYWPTQKSSILLTIYRDGGTVTSDTELVAVLSGAQRPADRLIRVAGCRNVLDWRHDFSLDLEMLVSSSPRLVRVAELLASGEVTERTAAAVETLTNFGQDEPPNDGLVEAGIPRLELERYVSLVNEPPSPDAVDRYVVYAASNKLTSQFIEFVDSERFKPIGASGFGARVLDVSVAGGEAVRFSSSDCEAFAHDDG